MNLQNGGRIQPEMAQFDPPSRKPHMHPIEPNMMGLGGRVAELWPFEVFQLCVNGPKVGRSLVVNIHTSYFLCKVFLVEHIKYRLLCSDCRFMVRSLLPSVQSHNDTSLNA